MRDCIYHSLAERAAPRRHAAAHVLRRRVWGNVRSSVHGDKRHRDITDRRKSMVSSHPIQSCFYIYQSADARVLRCNRQHREVLRHSPDVARSRWSTPAMRVLVLLVESGAAYCIILVSSCLPRTRPSVPHCRPDRVSPSRTTWSHAPSLRAPHRAAPHSFPSPQCFCPGASCRSW